MISAYGTGCSNNALPMHTFFRCSSSQNTMKYRSSNASFSYWTQYSWNVDTPLGTERNTRGATPWHRNDHKKTYIRTESAQLNKLFQPKKPSQRSPLRRHNEDSRKTSLTTRAENYANCIFLMAPFRCKFWLSTAQRSQKKPPEPFNQGEIAVAT